MLVALASTLQDDFGEAMWQGRKAPKNAVYDAVNALVNDEGLLFRRGGSALLSTSDAAHTPHGLADVLVAGGPRTLIWPGDPTLELQVLSGTTPATVFTGARLRALARAIPIPSGMVAIPLFTGASVLLYAGSLLVDPLAGVTGTVTNGSRTVTTTGSFTGKADPGTFLNATSGIGVVQSVDTSTSLTLREPWAGTTGAGTSLSFSVVLTTATAGDAVIAVGFAGHRMLAMTKSRVYFSSIDGIDFTTATDYLQIQAEQLIGIQGMGDSAVVFASNGVYRIDNLELTLIDDFGNIQISVSKINSDIVLWADSGLATYQGALVTPAIDDLWMLSTSGEPAVLTGPGKVRDLYRSYVKAGHRPGTAVVHRGHYFLPIVNSSNVLVDALVCRLDRGAAFTRWSGGAGSIAYAQRIGASNSLPQLFGISGLRVTDLTGCFSPAAGNSQDHDGSDFDATIITNDYPLGASQPGFCQRVRVRAIVTDDANGATTAPTAAIAYSSDEDAGAWTTLTERGEQGGAAGWGTSSGARYWWALVAKRRERIRFRITFSGASASTILRTIELLIRPQGRQ